MDGVRLASLRSKRGLAVAGILIVAVVVGIAVGFGMGGGGGQAPLPTTGAYAPISVPKPLVPTLGYLGPVIADPDSMIRQGQDLQELLAAAPGSGRPVHLTISNVSGIGYINSFEWYPPAGVNIVKLIGSTGGHCVTAGTSGFGGNQFKTVTLDPGILCTGINLKPPTCLCRSDGGSVVITFVANAQVGLSGVARVASATPVLANIPSYPGAPSSTTPDLPLCAVGQVSTKATPCASP